VGGGGGGGGRRLETLPMYRYSAITELQDLQKSENPKHSCCLDHCSNREYPN